MRLVGRLTMKAAGASESLPGLLQATFACTSEFGPDICYAVRLTGFTLSWH